MAIPDYQSIMLPLLRHTGDRQEHSLRTAIEALAIKFTLTAAERKELLPSGQQAIFDNRVGWAITYLKKAGLLAATRRGYFQITERGLETLSTAPSEINDRFLSQFPEFREFKKRQKPQNNRITHEDDFQVIKSKTPRELIGLEYQQLRQELELELLSQVKACSPSFFEKLVVNLLVKMGYGGSIYDAGTAIGTTGDEGIDGIIKEDKLGLDLIYVQAKRWNSTVVGRPEIHKFVGALQGQKARKGVFIVNLVKDETEIM